MQVFVIDEVPIVLTGKFGVFLQSIHMLLDDASFPIVSGDRCNQP